MLKQLVRTYSQFTAQTSSTGWSDLGAQCALFVHVYMIIKMKYGTPLLVNITRMCLSMNR